MLKDLKVLVSYKVASLVVSLCRVQAMGPLILLPVCSKCRADCAAASALEPLSKFFWTMC